MDPAQQAILTAAQQLLATTQQLLAALGNGHTAGSSPQPAAALAGGQRK